MRNTPRIVMTLFAMILVLLCIWTVDLPLTESLRAHPYPTLTAVAKQAEKLGYALYALLPITLLMISNRLRGRSIRYLLFLWLAIALSGLLCDGLKILFGRARPQTWFAHYEYGFYGISLHASHWSFPSGHTTTTAALMTGLWLRWPRLWHLCLGLTLAVGCARVITFHHYVSDVLVGACLGVSVAMILARRLSRNRHFGMIADL
jgi:membrane-associated phospholipid phosphatase